MKIYKKSPCIYLVTQELLVVLWFGMGLGGVVSHNGLGFQELFEAMLAPFAAIA